MTESCCPTKLPAQPTEYEGKGRIQDDNSYMTNVNQEKERAILMIHDIFGITPQVSKYNTIYLYMIFIYKICFIFYVGKTSG